MTKATHRLAALTLFLAVACGDPPREGEAPGDGTSETVTVYFSRDEEPVPVVRDTPESPGPSAAITELLEGPTAAEREEGVTSWFSDETADHLRSLTMHDDGDVVVDFHDLRDVIPGASSSAGSARLLGELNATLLQFPEVRTVEYRMEGSCEAFWNWLQYDCRIVTRSFEP